MFPIKYLENVFSCWQFPTWRPVPTQPVYVLLALLVLCLGMGCGNSIAAFDTLILPLHLPLLLVGDVSRLEPIAEEGHFLGAARPTGTLYLSNSVLMIERNCV